MAIRFLSNQTINGTLDLTNRVKVSGNSTDQYFYEGERTGVGVTLRLYDNSNTIYFDGYTGIVLRANQIGGSGGSIVFTGGNVGVGTVPAASVAFDVKEADTANDLIVGLTAGTGARAQIRSVVQSANTESAISFHTTLSSSTQEKLRILATGALSVGNSGTNYGTSGQVLTSTGNAVPQWTTPTTGTITGSGTANTVTKFTGASAVGDGPITFSSNDSTFSGLITATKTQDAQSLFRFINASTGTSATSRVVAEADAGSVQLIAAGSNFSGVSGAWQDAGVVCTSSMSGGLILASDNGVAINANGGTRALTISSSNQSATFTGQISGIGGNAATPSYIFEGNTDTGFFHPATDAIGFSTAGQEVMRIDANGNVAIQPGGATLTNTRLNVVSADNYDPSLFDGMGGIRIASAGSSSPGDGNYTGGIGFALTSGTSGIAGVQKGSDADKQGLAFFTHPSNTGGDAAEEKMRLDADGNLGIGTISPNARLESNANVTFSTIDTFGQIVAKSTSGALGMMLNIGVDDGGDFCFLQSVNRGVGATPLVLQRYAANVGIGTTSPGAKLEIFGTGNTLRLDSAANQSKTILLRNVGSGTAEIKTDGDLKLNAEDSGKTIQFFTEDTERMRIEADGDVLLTEGNFTMSGATPFIVLSNTAETESGITFVDSADPGQSAKITYDASGNDFKFYNNSTNVRMVIQNDGKVGIGTTAATANLEVGGANSTLRVGPRYPSGGDRDFVDLIAHGTDSKVLSNNERFHIENNSGDIIINPLSNVGIGTTSPLGKLMVRKDQAGSPTRIIVSNNGTVQSGTTARLSFYEGTSEKNYIERRRDGSGKLAFVAPANDNPFVWENTSGEFMRFVNSRVGIATTNPIFGLDVNSTGAFGGTGSFRTFVSGSASGSFIEFGTNADNDSLGALGTFASAFIFTTNQGLGFKWQYAGNDRMRLTTGGTLTVSGDVVAYGSPSDVRLKENIKTIESALDKVSKLQGVTFDWKKSDNILDIKEDIGFIAQDVQKVVPELVRENEDGMLSMRHQGVVPILLEAIKELEARVKELEKKQ